MVKRYVMTEYPHECCMEQDDAGQYVHYDDYAALQAENERLKVEVKVTEDNLAFAMRTISEIEIEVMAMIDEHKAVQS